MSPAAPPRHRVATAATVFAAATAALAAAAPATAAPKATTFRVAVEGTQTTTWKYVKRQAPSCDWPEEESGEQTITFGTTKAKPGTLKVRVAKDGTPSFSGAVVTVPAAAELRRDFDRRYADISGCPGGGSGGGQGKNENVQGSRSCKATGAVRLRFGTSRKEVYDAGDPMVQNPLKALKPGWALLRGAQDWPGEDRSHSLPATCADHDQGDADIAITQGRGEWGGSLIESRAPLPLKQLLKARKGSRTVRVKTVVVYPNPEQQQQPAEDTEGRTVLDLRLTFRR
ncbi:hypothetical protein AB0L40_26200 [Patulibacter sp. NPDC049589]|uniref:hypothetical protein n=1 Tax=Patulibacter sp. NPDC049589 TaxID=3154731 RepID=UPI00342A647A